MHTQRQLLTPLLIHVRHTLENCWRSALKHTSIHTLEHWRKLADIYLYYRYQEGSVKYSYMVHTSKITLYQDSFWNSSPVWTELLKSLSPRHPLQHDIGSLLLYLKKHNYILLIWFLLKFSYSYYDLPSCAQHFRVNRRYYRF